jgi:hypothetical protein
VDHTLIPSTQINFPVLVALSNTTLKTVANGGHVQRSDGFDINFYADSTHSTKLKWEIESYDGSAGTIVAWVNIPSLSSGSDTVFYMFYGDATITTDQSDPANTWDSNFKAVWHMADNAASTTIRESTATGVNATNNANTNTKTIAGQIGNALSYNGTSDGSSATVNLSSANIITLSAWINWGANANNDALAFEYTTNYNATNGFIIDWNSSSGGFDFGMSFAGTFWTDAIVRPSATVWHLVHLVMDRLTPINKLYRDGSSQTISPLAHTGSGGTFANSSLYFMSRAASSLNAAGTLDEVRLSTIERSADWITTEYNNQNAPGTFITLGAETSGAVGNLTLRTGKTLTATLPPIAILSRRLAKSLTATFAPTALMNKLIRMATMTRSLASITLSFTGNLGVSKTFVRALTATLSFAAILSRRTGKTLIAALTSTATFTKKLVDSGFTATLSFTGIITKNIRKNLTAALSFVGNLATTFIAGGGHVFNQALTASLSFVGAFTKLPQKVFTPAFSPSAALTRKTSHLLTATLAFIGALAKAIRDAGFAATLSFTGFLTTSKSFLKSLTATLSFTGTLAASKSFLKAFAASLSFTGLLSVRQVITRAFTAALSTAASLRRSTGKSFNATFSTAASLIKRVAHTFSATLAPVGALVKAIRDAGFTATLSFAGTLTTAAVHFFTRSFTATLSFVGALSRTRIVARVFSATLSMNGTIWRKTTKVLAATLNFSTALGKRIRKVFGAILSFVGFLFKGGVTIFLAGQRAGAALIGIFAGSTTRIGKAGSQLDIREAESGAEIPVTGSQLRVERTK